MIGSRRGWGRGRGSFSSRGSSSSRGCCGRCWWTWRQRAAAQRRRRRLRPTCCCRLTRQVCPRPHQVPCMCAWPPLSVARRRGCHPSSLPPCRRTTPHPGAPPTLPLPRRPPVHPGTPPCAGADAAGPGGRLRAAAAGAAGNRVSAAPCARSERAQVPQRTGRPTSQHTHRSSAVIVQVLSGGHCIASPSWNGFAACTLGGAHMHAQTHAVLHVTHT